MKKYFYQVANTIDPSIAFKRKELHLKIEDYKTNEEFQPIFQEEIVFTQMALFRAQSMSRMLPMVICITLTLLVATLASSMWFSSMTTPFSLLLTLFVGLLAILLIIAPQVRVKELRAYLAYLHCLTKMNAKELKEVFLSDNAIDFTPKAQFTGEKKELCALFKAGGFVIYNERAFFSAISKIIADQGNKQFKELYKTYNKLETDGYTEQLASLHLKFKNN